MSDIQNLIADYLSHCKYEKNLSPLSLKAYEIDLNQFHRFLINNTDHTNVCEINKNSIRNYIVNITPQNKPKTIKRKLATIKAFMNHLEFEDIIAINPFRKIRLNIKEGKQLPKTIELKNIKKLFHYLYTRKKHYIEEKNNSFKYLMRDIAVLELMFISGMRVSEISNLHTINLNLSKGTVLVIGKGNRERIIPIPQLEIIEIFKKYYELFKQQISCGDYFFVNRLNKRFSEQSIRLMIRKYYQAAHLNQHITPHMFRHSMATLLLENGVDIRYIQNILGHSSINTTQIYTQVNEAPKRKIIELKHPRSKFRF